MRLHSRWWDLKAERILNLGESFRLESFIYVFQLGSTQLQGYMFFS